MLALPSFRIDSYSATHPISIAAGGVISWGQFVRDVMATQTLLADAQCTRWALFEEDSYRMAVGLYALWNIGATVYLPGDNHRAVIDVLQAEEARFLGQFPTVQNCYEVITFSKTEPDGELRLSGELVVFTSGSSGKPKLIPKRMHQLDAELSALEAMWGDMLGQSIILGTVSHQHLYGFIFTVLWPLCAGRMFWQRPFFDALSMCQEAKALPSTAWIMSPAHLHRLSQNMPWNELGTSLSAIFSSGGPLNFDAAQATFKASGLHPVEIFGSSETGAIAWRQQAIAGQAWETVSGVVVKRTTEGALAVRSPFLPDTQWYVTADAVSEISHDKFQLGRRLDRIIKIEGKRVSLPEIEELLIAHHWLVDAVATPLTRRRLSVAAVMVLSEAGEEALSSLGKRVFIQRLKTDISSRLSSVGVPRFWRIVPELPRNSQGKLRYKDVEALFEPGYIPELLSQTISATKCELYLKIPLASPYFNGHFPNAPVLPGVVQILWAEHFGRKFLGVNGLFQSMRTVKFKEIIHPGSELQLTLEYTAVEGRLQFHYKSSSGEHSQGRLMYGESP